MSQAEESERICPYFVEVEGIIEPTPGEFERGRRFAQALKQLKESLAVQASLEVVESQYLTFKWSSFNDFLIVVNPSSPVEREVERGDNFYEWTSPHEKSTSDAQLVISHLELVSGRPSEALSPEPLISAISPSYRIPSMPLQEIAKLNLTSHEVAIYQRHRSIE